MLEPVFNLTPWVQRRGTGPGGLTLHCLARWEVTLVSCGGGKWRVLVMKLFCGELWW